MKENKERLPQVEMVVHLKQIKRLQEQEAHSQVLLTITLTLIARMYQLTEVHQVLPQVQVRVVEEQQEETNKE